MVCTEIHSRKMARRTKTGLPAAIGSPSPPRRAILKTRQQYREGDAPNRCVHRRAREADGALSYLGISSPSLAAAWDTSLSPRPDKLTITTWSLSRVGARWIISATA